MDVGWGRRALQVTTFGGGNAARGEIGCQKTVAPPRLGKPEPNRPNLTLGIRILECVGQSEAPLCLLDEKVSKVAWELSQFFGHTAPRKFMSH